MTTIRKGLMLAAVCVAGQQQAAADVTFGLGFGYVFGGGPTIGAKLFTNDEPDHVAGTIGLDYRFREKTLRPHAGIAYLKDNLYVDATVGWHAGQGALDYAVGAGWVRTDDHKAATPAPSAPAPAPATDATL